MHFLHPGKYNTPLGQLADLLKTNGFFIHRHKFYVLPTESIYVFYMIFRENSYYLPIQH
jgi:hypothetical protein